VYHMVGPGLEHVAQWLQKRSVLVEVECLWQELPCLWIEPSEDEEVSLGSYHVPGVVWNVELVLDHNCLRHVVHYFV
jgi:hypothetical protein